MLTLAGIVIPFIALSFSKYKLPHYIYVLFPLFAILTASGSFYTYRKVYILEEVFKMDSTGNSRPLMDFVICTVKSCFPLQEYFYLDGAPAPKFRFLLFLIQGKIKL